MTPGEPGAPPAGDATPPPPAPRPEGTPVPSLESAGVPRYVLFVGPLVDQKTKADDARRAMHFFRGWEAYHCAAYTARELLAWVEANIDESEAWWQLVDVFERVLIFSSYDPRPRH